MNFSFYYGIVTFLNFLKQEVTLKKARRTCGDNCFKVLVLKFENVIKDQKMLTDVLLITFKKH